nr:uncharacterized protein LOC117275076 [Nicotiana tomentosiformis]
MPQKRMLFPLMRGANFPSISAEADVMSQKQLIDRRCEKYGQNSINSRVYAFLSYFELWSSNLDDFQGNFHHMDWIQVPRLRLGLSEWTTQFGDFKVCLPGARKPRSHLLSFFCYYLLLI